MNEKLNEICFTIVNDEQLLQEFNENPYNVVKKLNNYYFSDDQLNDVVELVKSHVNLNLTVRKAFKNVDVKKMLESFENDYK